MSAHKYWRLSCPGLVTYVNILELEMYSLAGGAGVNQCTGGTATAHHNTSGNPASSAFDSDDETYWEGNAAAAWIKYEFASNIEISGIFVSSSLNSDFHPDSLILASSDDDVTYTDQTSIGSGLIEWINEEPSIGYVYIFYDYLVSVPATEATLTSEATAAGISLIQSIGANAATLSSYAAPAFQQMVQSIGASEATLTSAATAATVGQSHVVGANPATLTSAATAATIGVGHVVGANEATLTSIATAVSISQIHYIGANEATLTSFAEVLDYVFLAVNYHIDNKAITTYSNFNFTGSCRFAGKTLFINDSGLFEYGGLTDNGTAIVPSLKTGKMCEIMGRMGVERSLHMKRIPTSRIGVVCDKVGGSIDLNVTEDNNAAIAYNKAIVRDGFATYNVPIGRGIKYNFLQLELAANACTSLNIESIEYTPAELRRRER